jgi:ArsR family transcriptional regulator
MAAESTKSLVAALKATAEPTRLRILALLARGELNVKDLTRILGQSQPRISRHLKLLAEAGLVERAREGSWAFFRLTDGWERPGLARRLLEELDPADTVLTRDRQRAEAVKRERETEAQGYFQRQAGNWDTIRTLYVAESEVEAVIVAALGNRSIEVLVDLGTGTARILELLAPRYRRGLGLDINPAMLAYARAKLDRAGLDHAQVRQGDIYHLPLADGVADAVVMHQILHYLSDPARAVQEAARILAPGGRLLIVDFAPHELEFLREAHAHERLGFSDQQVRAWLTGCGLAVGETRHLAPTAGATDAPRLTVSLWQASRAGGNIDQHSDRRLERTS